MVGGWMDSLEARGLMGFVVIMLRNLSTNTICVR